MRTILLLVFTLSFMSANAQLSDDGYKKINQFRWNPQKTKAEIWEDAVNSTGFRQIECSFRVTANKDYEKVAHVGLSAFSVKDSTEFHLNFIITKEYKVSVREGSPVLIKFGDDSRLNLTVHHERNDYIGTTMNALGKYITTYDVVFSCIVAPADIERMKLGMKKIRVELNNNVYDIDLTKDNLSAFLVEEYNLINEALGTVRNFDDDF